LVIYPNVVNLRFKVDVRVNATSYFFCGAYLYNLKMDDRDCMVDYQYKIEDGHLSTEQNYGLIHLIVNKSNFFISIQ
jgi:DNA mismatch repair protein MSH4